MSDIEKASAFDPAAAVNAIRDKIRGQMLDVIPTEQWDNLIKAEMQAFMTDQPKKDYYGRTDGVTPAGFKQIVRSILDDEAKKRVRELLGTPEWLGQWSNDGKTEAGRAVRDYVTEMGPEILRVCMNEIIAQSVQAVLNDMKSRI